MLEWIVTLVLCVTFLSVLFIGILHVWLRSTVGKFTSHETMIGKTVLITGGNSGLGLETVKDLATRGARIIMASRKVDVASKLRDEIVKASGNDKIFVKRLDLSSQKSIREFSDELLKTETCIDVLIHNSGCASTFKKRQSVDGIEMTMATNHYGPFLLTHLLINLLKNSQMSRIVIVSSAYYKIARVNLENLNPIDVFPMYLYYVSKTANIMFGLELARRLADTEITVNIVNPGMCSTAIFKKVPFPLNFFVKNSFKNAKEGAQTTIMCAVSQKLHKVTGKYFSDCRETGLMKFILHSSDILKFWEESAKIVKLSPTDPQI